MGEFRGISGALIECVYTLGLTPTHSSIKKRKDKNKRRETYKLKRAPFGHRMLGCSKTLGERKGTEVPP